MSNTVFVLYKVINSDADAGDPCFNAFVLPNGVKPTLASVKQHCTALYGLNHLGPEGYHWRVCLQDRPIPGDQLPVSSDHPPTSWWDIQDENASLPIKESTQYQLQKFLNPPPSTTRGDDTAYDHYPHINATNAAKATFKTLGKVMSQAVGAAADHHHDSGPTVKVVAFKLLDLIKVNDQFTAKHHGTSAGPRSSPSSSSSRVSTPATPATTTTPAPVPPQHQRAAPPHPPQRPPPPQQQPHHRASPPKQQQRPHHQQQPSEPSLMDFGPPASTTTTAQSKYTPPVNESRAEKLRREYTKKQETSSRVWDDVDQRWVEKDTNIAAKVNSTGSSSSSTMSSSQPTKKVVGITLDPANAVGKSATVQAAVHDRVNTMRREQEKAVQEVREREAKKKQLEIEEDEVRKRLEPKIKAWSEEHGKKKQLRALLASLHVILWTGAKWKQVTIGDLLDDKKVLRSFQRASLVVHPDKTGHLDSEQRFLAKRIFDALCQAKAQFDDGK